MTRYKIGPQIGVIVHGKGINAAHYRMAADLEGRVAVKRPGGFTTIHEKRKLK